MILHFDHIRTCSFGVRAIGDISNYHYAKDFGVSYIQQVNRPITISSIKIDLEKQIDFLDKRLIRVLNYAQLHMGSGFVD